MRTRSEFRHCHPPGNKLAMKCWRNNQALASCKSSICCPAALAHCCPLQTGWAPSPCNLLTRTGNCSYFSSMCTVYNSSQPACRIFLTKPTALSAAALDSSFPWSLKTSHFSLQVPRAPPLFLQHLKRSQKHSWNPTKNSRSLFLPPQQGVLCNWRLFSACITSPHRKSGGYSVLSIPAWPISIHVIHLVYVAGIRQTTAGGSG